MNYIRILSKSSLLSSSSSAKSIITSEEVTKLQAEIEKLKQTVESLKLTVESRDAAIGTLAREKEKLYIELKTAQRTNRNLHQQLEDERDIHSKEKEYLIEDIKRVANKNESKSNNYLDNHQGDTIANIIREEVKSKDEVICNICAKYLKIKRSKTLMLQEFRTQQNECQKACENIIMLLEENKKSLDDLLQNLIEFGDVPPDTKKYFRILGQNANLHYENIQLKVRLTSSLHNKHLFRDTKFYGNNLEKSMEKIKNVKSTVFNKSLKVIRHNKKFNSKNCFCSMYNITSPYLNKSNSDTCLALLRN